MSYMCAECRQVGCKFRDLTKTMADCPSKNEAVQAKAAELYKEEENYHIANVSAKVEAEGYGKLCRMEAIRRSVWCSAWACTMRPGKSTES